MTLGININKPKQLTTLYPRVGIEPAPKIFSIIEDIVSSSI